MSTDTTTTTAAPASAPTGLPRRRQRTEWFSPNGSRAGRVGFEHLSTVPNPEGARRFGEQVQAASQQTARANGLLDAARLLDAAAAMDPDDATARLAADLAGQARRLASPLVVVPEPSRIRPEVPPEQRRA